MLRFSYLIVWCLSLTLFGSVLTHDYELGDHIRDTRTTAQSQLIPASSIAPWYVFARVDALNSVERVGLTVIFGDYWERSFEPYGLAFESATQELTNTANGNYATYSNLDMGSGVDSLMLRIALASGTNQVEVRLRSSTGPVIGSCTVQSTGAVANYRTVGCPMNPQLARGVQNITIVFPGSGSAMRFNWFAFWARGTVQRIDEILKRQYNSSFNAAGPSIRISGRPVRSRAMLPGSGERFSQQYRLWTPADSGDCPQWMHDTYWTRGDDGKIYSTWHPPVDFNPETGTYCTYGHDHGDDPRGSEVFTLNGWPAFGYVNELHSVVMGSGARHEDHFGHKVFVANGWRLYNSSKGSQIRRCNVLIKLHMGTHSPDALSNSAHELFVSGQCEGLQPFNVKQFGLFGIPGTFREPQADGCNNAVDPGVLPNPSTQPSGGMHRAIPTNDCYMSGTPDQQRQLLSVRSREFWLTGLLGSSYYFTFLNPARVYNATSPTKISRTVDLCYQPSHPMSLSLLCQEAVSASSSRIAWNDTRSPFRGSVHSNTHFSGIVFKASPSVVMYTDAYGRYSSTTPDAAKGIIFKQLVPTVPFSYKVDGQISVIPAADFSANSKNGVRARMSSYFDLCSNSTCVLFKIYLEYLICR